MTISDIMVSPVTVFTAPVGTTLPADSLGVGGTWPSGWVQVGTTKTPLSIDYAYEKVLYEIQESIGPVGSRKTKESMKLETVLAEFNMTGISYSWGGTVSTTSASAGQVGKEEIVGGDVTTVPIKMWGFEGTYEDSNQVVRPFRFIIYRGQSETGGKLEFGKQDTTGIPLKVEALEDMTKTVGQRMFKIQRITADAL